MFFILGIFIPLAGLVDIQEEIERLEKELTKWQGEIDRVEKKLSNERFVSNAPDKIVEEEKAKEKDYKDKYESVSRQLEKMKTINEGNE